MKPKIKLGALILASSLMFGSLVGCKPSGGGGGPEPEPDVYTVTVPASVDFEIQGIEEDGYIEGAEVSFTVTLAEPEVKQIDSVMYDTVQIQAVEGIYSFNMPARNVTLTVNVSNIPTYELTLSSEEIIVGQETTATLVRGTTPILNFELTSRSVSGDGEVSIDENIITGVHAGVVELTAVVGTKQVKSIEVTVREPEKGETPDNPMDASDAYQAIQGHDSGWRSESQYYIRGIVRDIVAKDTTDTYVTYQMDCENASHDAKTFTVYKAECDATKRALFDVGSDIIAHTRLYRYVNTFETSGGEIYSISNVTPLKVYADKASKIMEIGETFNPEFRIAPKGTSSAAISYVSDKPAVATVTSDGAITAVGKGVAKITASSDGFPSFIFTAIVADTEHLGTADDPFTVDEAVALTLSLPSGEKTDDAYYVKGIVTEVVDNHPDGYTNSTFYLDGTTKDFYCYRVGTPNDHEKLVKGAEVLASFKLNNFSGTPENDGGSVATIDNSVVRLIEFDDYNFQISLQDPDFDLASFGAAYPSALNGEITYTSGNTDVFTIINGKIHPVAAGENVTLTATCGDATTTANITVVAGAALDKWANTFNAIAVEEIEYPTVPEGTADKKTIKADTRVYVVCRITDVDTSYGNGVIKNKARDASTELYGMYSFDGKYKYSQLTNKPTFESVVVLYGFPAVYYRNPNNGTSKYELADCWVMQIDGVVQTTPDIVGIKFAEEELNTKVGKTADPFTVKSTRDDAPLNPDVAITWEIVEGADKASINASTGAVTGLAIGDATVKATYGTTGFTTTGTVHVLDASVVITKTVTISASTVWFAEASGTTDQVVAGVRFQLAESAISSDMMKVYKNKTLKIGGNNITVKSIEFTCTANGTAQYGPGSFGTGAPTGYVATTGKTGTWTGLSADAVQFTAASNQVRITKIVITYDF